MISVEKSGDLELQLVLGQLVQRMDDLTPALLEIGEDMVESSKQRFATTTGPDGKAWAPNSPLTMARYLGMFKGSRKADGSLSKKGEARAGAKKPGTGETKALQTTINYQLDGASSVSIGSPMVYAAAFQFGAQSGEFGFGVYATRNGSFPIPWGNVPARPFLGFSDSDRASILETVRSYIVGDA